MPPEFPALADIDVVAAMRKGAQIAGIPYRVGPTQSKDSFYGEVEPDRMPVSDRLNRRWKAWVEGGAVCSEMEAAAIFIISAIHRKRAGGVMLMASMEEDEDPEERAALWDIDRAISVAVEGLKILIEQDKQQAAH
jgi:uridine phosphorylase